MLEALVVMFLLFMLAIVLLPALVQRPQRHAMHINCQNNLKQMGLAFRIWEGDHDDKYPMAVSVTNWGAMEAVRQGNPLLVFQVMSNELSTPKLLICPNDKLRTWATSFSLTTSNVSYFLNIDAVETEPQDIMSGDDNFDIGGAPVHSGLLTVLTNTPIAWSRTRHKFSGYLLMADGSAQQASNSNLKTWFFPKNSAALRLAMP